VKRQFAVTHTNRQTEIPALPDSWVNNKPYFKVLCPQKHCFSLHFRKTITYLSVGPLRIGKASSFSCKSVYRCVTLCGLNRKQWQALLDAVRKLSVQHDSDNFLIV